MNWCHNRPARWWVAAARREQIPWHVVVVVEVRMEPACGLSVVCRICDYIGRREWWEGVITELKQSMY